MKFKCTIPLFYLILIFSCNTQIPRIEGLDYSKWINDRYGCSGEREKLVNLINDNKELFQIPNFMNDSIIDNLTLNLDLKEGARRNAWFKLSSLPDNCL